MPKKAKALLTATDVLDKLRSLIIRTHSPIVQQCLRDARKEIAFLSATDGPFTLDEAIYEEMTDDQMVQGQIPTHTADRSIGKVA